MQNGKLSVKREISAGGVVYRKFKTQSEKGKVVWLVAKHSGYKKWVLPKGLIDEGETAEKAAVREVKEETGVEVKIIDKLSPAERYIYTLKGEKIFKIVQYFLMEYVRGDIRKHDWEMEEVCWLPLEETYRRLEFSGQKRILKLAKERVEHSKKLTGLGKTVYQAEQVDRQNLEYIEGIIKKVRLDL